MKKTLFILFSMALSQTTLGGIILSAIDATASSERDASTLITNTISQAGLRDADGSIATYTPGVDDFDIISDLLFHSFNNFGQPNEWFTAFGTESAIATFNLGQAYTLDAVALWVEDATTPHRNVTFSGSLNNVDFTSILDVPELPDNPTSDLYPATVYTFEPVELQYFQVSFGECGSVFSSQVCSLGEIAFSQFSPPDGGGSGGDSGIGSGGDSGSGSGGGTGGNPVMVPEPSSLVIMLIGLIGLSLKRLMSYRA